MSMGGLGVCAPPQDTGCVYIYWIPVSISQLVDLLIFKLPETFTDQFGQRTSPIEFCLSDHGELVFGQSSFVRRATLPNIISQ